MIKIIKSILKKLNWRFRIQVGQMMLYETERERDELAQALREYYELLSSRYGCAIPFELELRYDCYVDTGMMPGVSVYSSWRFIQLFQGFIAGYEARKDPRSHKS